MEASEHGTQCFLLSPHTTYCPLYYKVVDKMVIFNHSFSLAHKELVAVLEIRKGQTGMPVLLNKGPLSGWHRDGRAGVRMSPDLIWACEVRQRHRVCKGIGLLRGEMTTAVGSTETTFIIHGKGVALDLSFNHVCLQWSANLFILINSSFEYIYFGISC